MTFPRILIIDDLYGRKPPNRDREDLCLRLGLKDITLDYDSKIRPEKIPDPVAEVVFCSGQVEAGNVMENDLSGTLDIWSADGGETGLTGLLSFLISISRQDPLELMENL